MPTPEHERARILWYIDVILIRYDVNDPANHTEHGQCGDERIDVETGDHDAVDEADDEPSERSDNDRRERTGSLVSRMTIAATIPPKPRIEPTETSMPPAKMT